MDISLWRAANAAMYVQLSIRFKICACAFVNDTGSNRRKDLQ